MAEKIGSSVGKYENGAKQCYNVLEDQRIIIGLLNQISGVDGGRRESPLPAHPLRGGVCSSELHQAILAFQRRHSGLSVDGHIDPGGQALNKLNELAAKPKVTPTPATGTISLCDVSASRYNTWPEPLLATLCNNFKLHGKSASGATAYPLPWHFGFSAPYKTFSTLVQMLDAAPDHSDIIKTVYDRIDKYPGLWRFFFLIFNTWKDRNTGFKFCCENGPEQAAIRDYLDGSIFFCRDNKFSQIEHQEYPDRFKNPSSIVAPTHQCWREIAHGNPGLHICLSSTYSQFSAYEGKNPIAVNDVHIDPQQPVSGWDKDGYCKWNKSAVIEHWWHEYGPNSGRWDK